MFTCLQTLVPGRKGEVAQWPFSAPCYGIAYLFMFAIAMVKPEFPAWLRCAALSGFAVTLLSRILAVFPIVQVTSWLLFGLEAGGVILVANNIGACIFPTAQAP